MGGPPGFALQGLDRTISVLRTSSGDFQVSSPTGLRTPGLALRLTISVLRTDPRFPLLQEG
eukprot:1047357-Amphidinium_carterae.1